LYGYIIYILYFILAYIQHNGDVSLKNSYPHVWTRLFYSIWSWSLL